MIDKRSLAKIRKRLPAVWGAMEQSGLIRDHPYRDDIIIRLIGSVYVDSDLNFFICVDNECTPNEYIRELYVKTAQRLSEIKIIGGKTLYINGRPFTRWI